MWASKCSHARLHCFCSCRSDTLSTSQAIQPSPGGPSSISRCAISTHPSNIPSNSTQEPSNFSVPAAQAIGRDPEAVGNGPVTLNLSSTSSSGKLPTLPLSSHPSSTGSSNPLFTNGSGVNGATSSQNNVPAIVGGQCFCCVILWGLTIRFVGVVGGLVFFACLSLLLFWLHLRHRSGGTPPYVAERAFSHRTLSTRSRGSYYPPSVPVYGHESETNKAPWQVPEVYVRFFSYLFSPCFHRSTPLFVRRVDRPSHPKSLYTAIPNLTCRPPTTPPLTGMGENIVAPPHSRGNPSRHLIYNLSIPIVTTCVPFPILISFAVILSSTWVMVITDTPGPFLLSPPFLRSDCVSPLPIINGADV